MTPRFVCVALLLLAHEVSGGVFQHTKDGRTLVWNNYPSENDVVIWSGKRDAQGYATGIGTLTWYRTDQAFQTGSLLPSKGPPVVVSRYSGTMVRGKFDGRVVNVDRDGKAFQLTFVNGIKTRGPAAEPAPSSDEVRNVRLQSSALSPAEGPASSPASSEAAKPVTAKETKTQAPPVDLSSEPKASPSPRADKPTIEVALRSTPPAQKAVPQTSDELDAVVKERMISDFREETGSVLSQVNEATGNFRGIDRLESVAKLPAPVSESVTSLAQRARDFRAKIGYDVALRDFKTETETVDALSAIDQVSRNVAANDASTANAKLTDFLKSNPEPGAESQKALWQYLGSMQQVFSRSAKAAEIHVQRAESFAAASRTSEAIRELQEAYRLFPSPITGEKIRQLQANSLGL